MISKQNLTYYMILLCLFLPFCVSEEIVGKCQLNHNGNTCQWKYITLTKKLQIYGNGEVPNYSKENNESTSSFYQFRNEIERIEIEDGITSIGNYSFSNMKQLKYFEYKGSNAITCDENAFTNTSIDIVVVNNNYQSNFFC